MGQEVQLAYDAAIIPCSSHGRRVGIVAKGTGSQDMLDFGQNFEIGIRIVGWYVLWSLEKASFFKDGVDETCLCHCHEFGAI
jgi:hypothetical protein